MHSLICLILRTSLEEGNDNPLQYSYLENPVDRGAWWASVHRVAQSRTQLKLLSMHACIEHPWNVPIQMRKQTGLESASELCMAI